MHPYRAHLVHRWRWLYAVRVRILHLVVQMTCAQSTYSYDQGVYERAAYGKPV